MSWRKEQRLNDWLAMLHQIYGFSQNYARTQYEILAHLSEVTGAFGKFMFKLKQPTRAEEFLPKMFGWAVALSKKISGDETNLEDIILLKYPSVCSYCISAPCRCVRGAKEPVKEKDVRDYYHRWEGSQKRSLNDFQAMFKRIYEQSWGFKEIMAGTPEAFAKLQEVYTRLVEELSELIESVRFVHLYPSNFDNELADYFAWFFALVSSMHMANPERDPILVEDLLWPAYPGICMVCMLDICDCRPRPVRELLSKPSLRALEFIDSLTQASNRTSFDSDLSAISKRDLPLSPPIACVHIDIDDFRRFNAQPFDHSIGDAALQHFATLVRQNIRNRDRFYRAGGDEFTLLCPGLSSEEAHGTMRRVASALKRIPIPAVGFDGSRPPIMTLSVGIVECQDPQQIEDAFTRADQEAIKSKSQGKDRITVAPLE